MVLTAGPDCPAGPAGPEGPPSPFPPAGPRSPLAPVWPSAPCRRTAVLYVQELHVFPSLLICSSEDKLYPRSSGCLTGGPANPEGPAGPTSPRSPCEQIELGQFACSYWPKIPIMFY